MFENDFLYRLNASVICLIFFLSILLMGYLGNFAGRKYYFKPEKDRINRKSLKSLEAGLFAIFSFLLGFTFHFTATRYDNTKMVLLDEANAIGSAIIMSDLYERSDKTFFVHEFRQYLETVIAIYGAKRSGEKLDTLKDQLRNTSIKLWHRASILSTDKKLHMASRNMIPALKEMFNAAYKREAITRSRLPDMILIMLFIISITCVFLEGFTVERINTKEKLLLLGFAVISTLVLFIILDYDRPYRGLITDRIGEESMEEKRRLFEIF